MSKIYRYMCKNCWKSWSSTIKYRNCPRCGSYDLDVDYDISL